MKILYLISKYATFFGALIKGLWEHITCGMLKVFVEDARYLQPNELCGHVEHSLPVSRAKAFLLAFLPCLINGVLAFFLGGAGFMGLFLLKVPHTAAMFWVYVVLLYLGISFLCNMFPLMEDAMNNWSLIYNVKLTEEDKARNAEIKEKIKANKAFAKAQKKLAKEKAKQGGKASAAVTPKQEPLQIKRQSGIVTKILLCIPSAILYAGAWLEAHAITFLCCVAAVALAIVLL